MILKLNGYKGSSGAFEKYNKLKRNKIEFIKEEEKLIENALIYLETPENPDCILHDLAHYIKVAKEKNCRLVV